MYNDGAFFTYHKRVPVLPGNLSERKKIFMEKSPVYYSDYLHLNKILDSQYPKSALYGQEAHDETLFIIVHQVYELWFKQILHEINSVIEMLGQNFVGEKLLAASITRLERVTRIQRILIEQLRVLETMTPLDFLEFRNYLIPASGFQSVQFRLLENRLGLKRKVLYNEKSYHTHFTEDHRKDIVASEEAPSLFEVIEKWLERIPFLRFQDFNFWENYEKAIYGMLEQDHQMILDNPILSEKEKEKQLEELKKTEENFAAVLQEEKHQELVDKGARRLSFKATQAALFIHLYRDEPILHSPFRLLNQLVDIDELFAAWRHRHALMAQRMIGTKIGTGGTTGHHYLRMTVDKCKVFSDFFNLATFFIPRSALLELPDDIKKQLGFYHTIKNQEKS